MPSPVTSRSAAVAHDRPGFRHAVEVRYPPGEDNGTGRDHGVDAHGRRCCPDEEPSPFQRISPLADCGNAFSRHADPDQVQFVNTDLVIALHRDPVGEWLGSRVGSAWQPTGVGLADALLFDDEGPVGRALQTLLLRPASGMTALGRRRWSRSSGPTTCSPTPT